MAGVISEIAKAKVRAYTQRNMDALVTIVRGHRGELDPVTRKVGGLVVDAVIYDDAAQTGKGGIARIHSMSGNGSVSNGVGEIDTRQATVSIPWSSQEPRRDDIVLVRDGGADTALTGTALRVMEVSGGGAFGDARRMSCIAWGKSQLWSGKGSS